MKYILNVLEEPSKMLKSNEFAIAASPYLFKPDNENYFVLLLKKKGVDINYLKTIISDYHTRDFPNETFDITAILMGSEKHLLIIKKFANMIESQAYRELFYTEQSIKKALHKKQHEIILISEENFRYFYKKKDLEGYKKYFQNKYLNKN